MFDRRKLLKAIGLGAGFIAGEPLLTDVAGLGGAVAQTTETRVLELGAAQAATAIRNGDLSAESYAETLIAQGAAWRHLNAFISEDADALREAARAADRRRRSGARLGPGLVIPAGLTEDGLPVGLEIDAPVMSDRRLLAIGRAIESVLPTLPPPGLIGEGIRNDAP